LNDPNQIAAGLIILALGDGVATLIGQYGVLKLPYNHKKTIEGTVAFFLSSLVGGIFIGPLIIPVAFLAAFVESLPIKFDDNLSVPIVITAFFLIFGGGG
jgi:dolichol kinase